MSTRRQVQVRLALQKARAALELPLPDEERIEILACYFVAIDEITRGRATAKHMDTLIYAVNIGRVLADEGIGEEYGEMIDQAMAAVQRCARRGVSGGRFGFDGAGIQAVRTFYDLHEAQLILATKGEIRAAIDEFKRRLAAGMKFEEREVT